MNPAILQELIANLAELQLQPGVTFDDVKRRWRILVRIFHPDKNAGDPNAQAEFQRIQTAFEFIRVYQQYLQFLAVCGSPGSYPPPPPQPPNPSAQTPSNQQTSTASTPQTPTTSTAPRRRPVRALVFTAFVITALCFSFVLLVLASVTYRKAQEDAAYAQMLHTEIGAAAKPAPDPEPPPPPPKPPRWEPVIRTPGDFPAREIATAVGTSEQAVRTAFSKSLFRQVDINSDGKNEIFITRIDGTCRKEGCPVFLFWNWRERPDDETPTLRDLLPNNYGLTSIAVLDHKTNGANDLIVTASEWSMAMQQGATPAQRPCKRLLWGRRTRYVYAQHDPTPEECFEAEKTAWNIAADYQPLHEARFQETR